MLEKYEKASALEISTFQTLVRTYQSEVTRYFKLRKRAGVGFFGKLQIGK